MTVFRGYADSSGWLERIKSGAANNSLTDPTFGELQDLLYSFDLQGNVSARSDRNAVVARLGHRRSLGWSALRVNQIGCNLGPDLFDGRVSTAALPRTCAR